MLRSASLWVLSCLLLLPLACTSPPAEAGPDGSAACGALYDSCRASGDCCGALACRDSACVEADAGAAGDLGLAEPDASDRVCTESYVCVIACEAGTAARRPACIDHCSRATLPEQRPLLEAVLECMEQTCGGARGAAMQPCMFSDCVPAMDACLIEARRVRNPCDAGPPNEQGVGYPCAERVECETFAAFNCPYSIPAPERRDEVNLPRWCSHLCEFDEDCGERAFCWQRRSMEGVLVGSCALRGCLVHEASD